jgi:hypothetical protein
MRNFQGSHTIFNIKVQGISRLIPGFNNKKRVISEKAWWSTFS